MTFIDFVLFLIYLVMHEALQFAGGCLILLGFLITILKLRKLRVYFGARFFWYLCAGYTGFALRRLVMTVPLLWPSLRLDIPGQFDLSDGLAFAEQIVTMMAVLFFYLAFTQLLGIVENLPGKTDER